MLWGTFASQDELYSQNRLNARIENFILSWWLWQFYSCWSVWARFEDKHIDRNRRLKGNRNNMVNLFVSGYAGTDKLGDSVNFTTTLTTLRWTQNVTMWKQVRLGSDHLQSVADCFEIWQSSFCVKADIRLNCFFSGQCTSAAETFCRGDWGERHSLNSVIDYKEEFVSWSSCGILWDMVTVITDKLKDQSLEDLSGDETEVRYFKNRS